MKSELTEAELATNVETQKHIDQVGYFIKSVTDELKQLCFGSHDFFQSYMNPMIGDLEHRAKVHDASKLERPEVEVFTEYTNKLKTSTYGSEEYEGYRAAMKSALDHHYANNSHHPEYYENGVHDMNLMDVTEMLCDWRAACLRHDDGDIWKSIDLNTNRFGLDSQLADIFRSTITVSRSHYLMEDRLNELSLWGIMEMFVEWALVADANDVGFERLIEVNAPRFGLSNQLKSIMLNTLDLFDD